MFTVLSPFWSSKLMINEARSHELVRLRGRDCSWPEKQALFPPL